MEGNPTSVSDSVQMPEQPTSGNTHIQPLGGNGATDPHSRTFTAITLASAAGGGTNLLVVRLDPRFTQLVAFVGVSVSGGVAATITGRVELDCGGFEQWLQSLSIPLADTGSTGNEHNAIWTPPNVLCSAEPNTDSSAAPRVRVIIPNVDGESLTLRVVCYNFDKRARERTPIGLLMTSIPRSTSIQV